MPESLKDWAKKEERSAIGCIHHGLGTATRNEWGLWYDTSPLHRHFNTFGIKHGDDISGILFSSLHRKLNGKDIDLKEQVKRYWKHWSSEDCKSDDYLPSNIKGVSEEYLELYNEFKKELDGKR